MNRTRPLHIRILIIVNALVLLTALGIGASTYWNTAGAVRRLADDLLRETTRQTAAKTNSFLGEAIPALLLTESLLPREASGRVFRKGVPTDEEWRPLALLLTRVLQSNPHFRMVHYGDASRVFVSAGRILADRSITVEVRWWVTSMPASRMFAVDPKGKLLAWSAERQADYLRTRPILRNFDPTVRPWYKAAMLSNSPAWTNPYLHASGEPGITASYRVDGANGPTGALGVDMALADLDLFVASLETDGKRVFILDDSKDGDGGVVAHGARERLTSSVTQMRLPKAAESKESVLRVAAGQILRNRKTFVSDAPLDLHVSSEQEYIGGAMPFSIKGGVNWRVVVVTPTSNVLGVVLRNSLYTVVICVAVILLSLAAGYYLSVQISRPLRAFAREMEKVGRLEITMRALSDSSIQEIHENWIELEKMKSNLLSFQKYVPADLVRLLNESRQEAKLGGQISNLTIFFADIVGFTAISEGMAPDLLVDSLAVYLEEMERIVTECGGIVDKYNGDAIMAFWGAPIRPVERPAEGACRAALAYLERFDRLGEERRARGETVFDVVLGVHTGDAVVGNIGSARRMNYTAMGDTVNLTSRLEGLNRVYGTRALISEATYEQVKASHVCREIDRVGVKGRAGGISIYELNPATRGNEGVYAEALALYRNGDFAGAADVFGRLQDDPPSRVMRDRCLEFAAAPPPDWAGVYYHRQK